MRWHATIGNLMLLMVVCGIGFAGLSRPSAIANELIFAVAALALSVAAVAAINRPRGKREYWVCFAVFGWAYLLLSLTPHGENRLPTTRALNASRDWLVRKPPESNSITEGVRFDWGGPTRVQGATWLTTTNGGPTQAPSSAIWVLANPSTPYEDYYLAIGHSFFSLLAAWLAALAYGIIAGISANRAKRLALAESRSDLDLAETPGPIKLGPPAKPAPSSDTK